MTETIANKPGAIKATPSVDAETAIRFKLEASDLLEEVYWAVKKQDYVLAKKVRDFQAKWALSFGALS